MDENIDLSNAIEKVKEMLSNEGEGGSLENIIEMLSGSSEGGNSQDTESHSIPDLSSLFSALGSESPGQESGFDIGTILKLQSIMSAINKPQNNADSIFLNALKPMLKKERRDKIDQAVKILNITKALKAFKNIEGGI